MEPLRKEAKDNPSASANLLSKIFFCWLNPLFRIGYKRKLEEDDMYNVLPEDASDRLGEELQCRSATSSECNPVFKPRQEQIYRSTLNMGLSTIIQTSSLNNSYSDNVGFATPADEAF